MNKRLLSGPLSCTLFLLIGCGSESPSTPTDGGDTGDSVTISDGGGSDATDTTPPGPGDVTVGDADPADDGGPGDATVVDAGPMDAGPLDMGAPDATVTDATPTDGDSASTPALWLLSVHTTTNTLLKVDVNTGAATKICVIDSTANYPSLTFSRGNQLLSSRAKKPWGLDLIDPCTCAVTEVGEYGDFENVHGITADHGLNLLGIESKNNQLIAIDADTGVASVVGPLSVDFTTGGASWTDELEQLYAINGGNDTLYTINPDTAVAEVVNVLDYEFGTVGMEVHPSNGVLYACSTAGDLLQVDPDTGAVTVIGPLGWPGACTNLAAPFNTISCVDDQ